MGNRVRETLIREDCRYLQTYYGDLHIHVGVSAGQVIKIPSAQDLTFANIAAEASQSKGLDIVGIVDCASPLVLKDIAKLIDGGKAKELPEGGLLYENRLLLILGAEIELGGRQQGSAHFLAFFPSLVQMQRFSSLLSGYVTNPNLSCQRAKGTPEEWFDRVESLGGLFIPAHVFTPFKSLFGNMAESLAEVFRPDQIERLTAVELGLSADTDLADMISDLASVTFLSNSDAHSLPKIAREYNAFAMESLCYREWEMALRNQKGRAVVGNYGLDPRLGKYHRTLCLDCGNKVCENVSALTCPECGSSHVVKGVFDRIREIGTYDVPHHPLGRPPYHYQVPLEFVPKVGPKTLRKLLNHFGSEMNVLHRASEEELGQVVGPTIAGNIVRARTGKLAIDPGGGGRYGKVVG